MRGKTRNWNRKDRVIMSEQNVSQIRKGKGFREKLWESGTNI